MRAYRCIYIHMRACEIKLTQLAMVFWCRETCRLMLDVMRVVVCRDRRIYAVQQLVINHKRMFFKLICTCQSSNDIY